MEFAARIRSFKSKQGGADIVMLQTPTVNGENLRGKMIEHAKIISENEGDLDGFIVLALFADGKRSMGFRLPKRIPREMLPAYFAEIIRTDAVTEWQAGITFDDKFEWRD